MRPGADDPGRREWPLILFTMGVQLACGLVLASAAADWSLDRQTATVARPLGVLVFPAVVLASLCSMFHLGRPRDAWKSLANLGSSRLSREVAFTALFALAAMAYSGAWWDGDWPSRPAIGMVTFVVAVAAVVAGAWIYVVPSRPVWNSAWVPMSFIATVLVTGGLGCVMVAMRGAVSGFLEAATVVVVAGALLQAVATSRMQALATAVARRDSDVLGVDQMVRVHGAQVQWSLRLHLVLAVAVPMLLACWWLAVPRQGLTPSTWTVAAGSALSGTLLGRRLMFTLGSSVPRF